MIEGEGRVCRNNVVSEDTFQSIYDEVRSINNVRFKRIEECEDAETDGRGTAAEKIPNPSSPLSRLPESHS